MNESGTNAEHFGEADRTALLLLRRLCAAFGSANDADDHGYADDARRMREDAAESIRNLAAQHPFLATHIPTLERELETGHIFDFGWANIYNAAGALLKGSSDAG